MYVFISLNMQTFYDLMMVCLTPEHLIVLIIVSRGGWFGSSAKVVVLCCCSLSRSLNVFFTFT